MRPTTSDKSISWVSTIVLGEKNLAPSKVGQTENFQTCLMGYNVSRMRAQNEPKTANLAEMRAEFCIFESNAPGLNANFYEPYVDMPTHEIEFNFFYRLNYLYETGHTCSSCLWLQNAASDFLIFVWGLSYGLSKLKKRGKIITQL